MDTRTKLQPFTENATCTKCGKSDESPVVAMALPPGMLPAADAGAVPFAINPAVFAFQSFGVQYCAGGKEPESDDDTFGPILAMIANILPDSSRIPAGPRKINICAGMTESHMHVRCHRCQFEFLMECKDTAVIQSSAASS
jgi:hypothetical protein